MKACPLLMVALLIGACNRAPPVPEISLGNVDYVIAADISNSLVAVRDAPRSSVAWGELGLKLKAVGLDSDARECFVQAEKLDPLKPQWPYHQDTIESLRRALTVTAADKSFIHTRLGQVLAEFGRWPEAEEHFRAAGNPLGLAQVACARGKWEEALPLLQQARQSEFAAKAATILLATAMLRLGRMNEAAEFSRHAEALPPDIPQPDPFAAEVARYATGKRAWIEETQRLLGQGQVADAQPIIERLIASYPNAAEGWLYRGRVFLLQNNLPAAEQALARHLQLDPFSVDGHLQMGLVHHRQNRLTEAGAEFQKALAAKPDSETTHYFLGVVRRAQGDWLAASNSFEAALRHQPTFTPARKALDELTRPR